MEEIGEKGMLLCRGRLIRPERAQACRRFLRGQADDCGASCNRAGRHSWVSHSGTGRLGRRNACANRIIHPREPTFVTGKRLAFILTLPPAYSPRS